MRLLCGIRSSVPFAITLSRRACLGEVHLRLLALRTVNDGSDEQRSLQDRTADSENAEDRQEMESIRIVDTDELNPVPMPQGKTDELNDKNYDPRPPESRCPAKHQAERPDHQSKVDENPIDHTSCLDDRGTLLLSVFFLST